mmetsp:Transcript_59900/g.71327  ORF Transcript_59900/g.71327 Transcript_59900/m.71327 type:complete len:290 (-) Transcript_59900:549-1418(-)
MDSTIKQTMKGLSSFSFVVIPTDKANSYRLIPLKECITRMEEQLEPMADEILVKGLKRILNDAEETLKTFENYLGRDEKAFIERTLKTKQIPSSELLIKDHKARKNGQFPLRLVIPTTNFTACFSKVGYLGLKQVLDSYDIDYSRFTIAQASYLKMTLSRHQLNRALHSIFSIDVINMYPSIKFSLIKKSVNFFLRNFPVKGRGTLNTCLKLIEFGMSSMLLSFHNKYYQYHCGDKDGERGLAIGGFESAFLADLVACYLLEAMIDLFGDEHPFKGMYRDDGIYVTNGK